MNTVFTHSSKAVSLTSKHVSSQDIWDQHKLTVFKGYVSEPDSKTYHSFIEDRLPPGYNEVPEDKI